MAKYISNRQRDLKIGITSYTESLTVLEVTGGAYISSSVGIGTTVASQSLHIQGNARITGALYDGNNAPGIFGQVLLSTETGIRWSNPGITTYADSAGIATYSTYAGYATTAGVATYAGYATTAGIATYATYAGYASTAGIATNLAGGDKNSIPYQTGVNTTGFIAYGNPGDILTTDGANSAPYWAPLSLDTLIGRLIVRDEGEIVGTAYSINQLDFRGPNIVATATSFGNIATITVADYVSNAGYSTNSGIATYATYAGIATYAPNAGIATYAIYAGYATTAGIATIAGYASTAGIATYAIYAGYATTAGIATIAGYASTAGIATYAPNAGISTNVIGGIASITSLFVSGISTLGTVKISSGIITAASGIVTYYGDGGGLINIQASAIVGGTGYVDYAGVSTNVIGGIASVAQLYVSGISTLGTVNISSGIVSATTGIVTYYGDGSNLIGIQTSGVVTVNAQDPTVFSPVYPTLVNNVGVSTLGISTTKLSFIPSTNKLGIGTGIPRENLDVIGSIGIQSAESSNRFYIQHNSSQSSLDFIFV
jgi:hypothetical protein